MEAAYPGSSKHIAAASDIATIGFDKPSVAAGTVGVTSRSSSH